MTAEPFSQGGALDGMSPSAELARILDEVSGADRRCTGLTDDEIIGVLGRWQTVESWAAAGKLGVVVALLCRRGIEALGTREPDVLPQAWEETLNEEVMLALGISGRAADKLIDLAWSLQARLPLTAAALSEGVIDQYKAMIIQETTAMLDDAAAGKAEASVAGKLAGKTPGEIGRLIDRAAASADPEGAEKRRKDAEEKDARVSAWREPTGTAAIGAFGGKADEVLAAEQAVQDLAAAYKKNGVPGTADQLRYKAMIDKLLDTSTLPGSAAAGAATAGSPAPGSVAARINLTLPALTVLGLADNPGESPGWGTLDPALVRDLATRAAAPSRSEWHLTLVDEHGWAVSHGCGNPAPGTKRGKNDPAGAGTLRLRIPGGQDLDFTICPIPVEDDCDHRYETQAHDPGPLLRHLAEVRDGT